MKIVKIVLAMTLGFASIGNATEQTSERRAQQGEADGGGRSIAEFSPSYATCRREASGRILAIDACMSDEMEVQDARLNRAYKALLRVLGADEKKALIEAEREWIRLDIAEGKFEDALYGNTQVANAQRLENDLYRVRDRVRTLEKYLSFARL